MPSDLHATGLIRDYNWTDWFNPVIDGERKSHGLVPRDYSTHPTGYLATAPAFPDALLIPESEWPARLAALNAAKRDGLSLRQAVAPDLDSLDQDGLGLCWAFSSTKAVMYRRARQGEPRLVLSAWYVAGKIKGWRNEGGWGASSTEFIATTGVPLMADCPSYSSSYDTAQTQANAALHRTQLWYDGFQDKDKNRAMMVSLFLMGYEPVLDFNWLSHSMCGCNIVSLSPLEINCDNSWGMKAGNQGLYNIKGDKAIPDGICVPIISAPSVT